jgi:SAM-dependent methyltransferase
MTDLRKLASEARETLRRRLRGVPDPGAIDFGDLRRTRPISEDFGTDRGLPIDRYYIERFLAANATDVRGRVLEIGNDRYTRQFGLQKVSHSDIWHVNASNPRATIIGDLAHAPHVPADSFDCIILTQTLQLIYDPRAALGTLRRILKPGGVLLITVPGISQVATRSEWGSSWYWAFTVLAVSKMLEDVFGRQCSAVGSSGNVLSAVAFLHGMAAGELTDAELTDVDPDYQLLISARAEKPSSTP